MQTDPFAHLNYEQIQAAEKKYRRLHPILWRVAEFVVFVRDPRKWVRNWRVYVGKPTWTTDAFC